MNLFTAPQLRDLFAMHAVSGYLAAHADAETALPKKAEVARYCYELADLLLAERDRTKPTVPAAPPEVPPPAPAVV